MRRYDRRDSGDNRDLDARLDALGSEPKRGSGSRSRKSRSGGPRKPRTSGSVRRRRRSNTLRTILGVSLVVVVLGAIFAIVVSATGGSNDEAPVEVAVAQGDTLSSVADKLESEGVIGSAFLFNLQARMGGSSDEIKPGTYTFQPEESNDQILAKLTEGEAVPTFAVTIPEGLTLDQTADAVGESGQVSRKQFLEAANGKDYGYAFLEDPAIKNTEGFLFPKSYEFEEGTDAKQIVNRLLEQYLLETQDVDIEGASERLNLTEYEIITVASLIEREAANDEERAIIASVIYNRIQEGMPLQIDATIQYARGAPKENLSLQDLKVKSPYNTYENPGLPPGPIASPSKASIEAAVEPADTNYLYYVLTADGSEHFFTNDYDEFLQAKQEAGL